MVDINDGGERAIAVTGVSGFLGQRLLPLLDASPRVDRIIGLDVRDPARRARKLEFHRTDVLGAELTPYLRGVSVIVHLAAVPGPSLDDALFTRVNVDGTRRLLDAAGAAGVRKVVRPSSASVYGAWPNNPVPTHRGRRAPSEPELPARDRRRRMRAVARGVGGRAGRPGGDAPSHRAGRRRRCSLVVRGGCDRPGAGTRTRRRPARAGRARRRRRRCPRARHRQGPRRRVQCRGRRMAQRGRSCVAAARPARSCIAVRIRGAIRVGRVVDRSRRCARRRWCPTSCIPGSSATTA